MVALSIRHIGKGVAPDVAAAFGDIEALANERFDKGVRMLNKVEASGLIDELLDTYGGANRQGNHGGSTRRNGSAYTGSRSRKDAA